MGRALSASDAPRLGDLRGLTISRRAAEEYALAADLDPVRDQEQARRELLRLLLDARLTHAAVDGAPAKYRARSRTTGIDITARVAEDGGLHIVTAVVVRGYRSGPGAASRRGGRGR